MVRAACTGAWRALEIVLAGDALRVTDDPAPLRAGAEAVRRLFEGDLALRGDALGELRAGRDALTGGLDMNALVSSCGRVGDAPAVAAGRRRVRTLAIDTLRKLVGDRRALAAALRDSATVALLVDAARAAFRHAARADRELARWAVSPTGTTSRDQALTVFCELLASPEAIAALDLALAPLADVVAGMPAAKPAPQTAPPQPAAPPVAMVKPAQPEPAKPEPPTTKAEAAKPEPAKPDAAKAEAAKPEPAKSDAAKPEAAKPEAAKPEPAKSDVAKPEPAKPEPAKPEPAKPEPAKSDAAKPEAAKPEPAKSDAAKPEAAKLEAAKPEPAKPEPAKPERPPSVAEAQAEAQAGGAMRWFLPALLVLAAIAAAVYWLR